jgi:undecaprenyl-diphosphatase
MLNLIFSFDLFISNFVLSHLSPVLVFIFSSITHLADTLTIFLFSILILFYLYKNKEFVKLKFFLVIMIFGFSIFSILKLLVQRARPVERLIEYSTYSFPSGHTRMATVLGIGVYFLFKDKFNSKISKNIFLVSLILFAFLVGLSRIYLNVHWFSDVLAGWILGLCVVIIGKKYF